MLESLPAKGLALVLAVGTHTVEQVAVVVASVCHDLPNFPCSKMPDAEPDLRYWKNWITRVSRYYVFG